MVVGFRFLILATYGVHRGGRIHRTSGRSNGLECNIDDSKVMSVGEKEVSQFPHQWCGKHMAQLQVYRLACQQ
jgi:hypothetical protein